MQIFLRPSGPHVCNLRTLAYTPCAVTSPVLEEVTFEVNFEPYLNFAFAVTQLTDHPLTRRQGAGFLIWLSTS
jgi:hypothetical protein